MINGLAMTAFMVVVGLAGKTELAADIGIVQAATLALFYAFSGNARNLILNDSFPVSSQSIMFSRLWMSLPLGILAFYLSTIVSGVEIYLAIILILRRIVEWLGEVHLSQLERERNQKFTTKYLIIQVALLFFALAWTLAGNLMPLMGLFVWAVSPLFFSFNFIYNSLKRTVKVEKTIWYRLLPHIGSSAIIGITVYIFRLLIISFTGKKVGGDLFTAFALGGILGSVFTNALGPSLAMYLKLDEVNKIPKGIKLALLISLIMGLVLWAMLMQKADTVYWLGKSHFFWKAIAYSMVGGVIMAFAQIIRHKILQHHDAKDLMGPDVLMNIGMIAMVPFNYLLLGIESMAALFFMNGIIALVFYMSSEVEDKLIISNTIRSVIAGIVICPIYFQLTGSLFNDSSIIFDSQGILNLLPIPISLIGCLLGIVLIGAYGRANFALNTVFFTFLLMILATILITHNRIDLSKDKLIWLVQFILPFFGFVLGQIFEPKGLSFSYVMEKGFFWVLVIIVPLQLFATWVEGSIYLYPKLFFFSIYQHLQYVPVVFVASFLLAFFNLWDSRRYKKILLLMFPLMGIYVAASMSMLAIMLLLIGLSAFSVFKWRVIREKGPLLGLIMCAVMIYVYTSYGHLFMFSSGPFERYINNVIYTSELSENPEVFHKDIGMTLREKKEVLMEKYIDNKPVHSDILEVQQEIVDLNTPSKDAGFFSSNYFSVPNNIQERFGYWSFYANKITETKMGLLFGHPERLNRIKSPSAHNYYLDLIYNFGFLSLIPLLVAIFMTMKKIYINRCEIVKSQYLWGISGIVIFLLLFDGFSKVSMRQPYSGVFVFYIWGILISRLNNINEID
jgi:hypothetical protein